jgi:hypothetical protein
MGSSSVSRTTACWNELLGSHPIEAACREPLELLK